MTTATMTDAEFEATIDRLWTEGWGATMEEKTIVKGMEFTVKSGKVYRVESSGTWVGLDGIVHFSARLVKDGKMFGPCRLLTLKSIVKIL